MRRKNSLLNGFLVGYRHSVFQPQDGGIFLSHWSRVRDAYICLGNLTTNGSDNGLLPCRHQAIIWTNAGLLLTGPLGRNFSEILIELIYFYSRKRRFKMSSVKWRPCCVDLNVKSQATATHLKFRDLKLSSHYSDVIMGSMAAQITSLTIVYSIVCSAADQRKHQSSASLAFVRGIHRWPVNSPHKWPVTRKMFPWMTSSWCHSHSKYASKILRGVACASWRIESLVYRCLLYSVQTNNKENNKAPHNWPFVREITGSVEPFPRHGVIMYFCFVALHLNISMTD